MPMFLVHSAAEIMERDVLVLEETTSFAAFNTLAVPQGGLQHVVVTRGGVIVGGLHVDADFRQALGVMPPEVQLKALMQRKFTIVRESDVAFDVITMMGRKRATMAIVVSHLYDQEAQRVLGVVTKAHVVDAVVRSIEIYPQ